MDTVDQYAIVKHLVYHSQTAQNLQRIHDSDLPKSTPPSTTSSSSAAAMVLCMDWCYAWIGAMHGLVLKDTTPHCTLDVTVNWIRFESARVTVHT